MKHLQRRTCTLVALVLLLGMSPVPPVLAQGAPAGVETVNLATYGKGIGPWCLYAAQEQGYLEQAHVQIGQWNVMFGDPLITTALVSGQADIALTSIGTLLPLANGQTDQLAIIAGNEGYPGSLIAPDSVTSPSQLAGKTIGMPQNNTSLAIIGANQIDALIGKGKWDAIYSGGSDQSHLELLVAGKVQAVMVNDPVTLDPTLHFHIVARLNAGQSYTNGAAIAGKNFLKTKPEAAVRFLAAYAKGCNFILDPKNRATAIATLIKGSGSSPESCAQAYDFYVLGPQRGHTPPRNASIDEKGLAAAVGLLKKAGTITNAAWDPKSAIDGSYLDRALKLAATLHG